ncbi:lytic transglycosylase domain-containing protein [Carboxylicivirga sp. M1479]|uniref:lytic transglycosylase domain-containing protein n=1 Tax=Carboxylicivirga sp. M1479 TaxID=2594476 RepID=UPI001178C915|nr:lytic transglycosylase domain-containing protein [Carboxylicivirga sp. M1479]TRX64595.1 LysM peptidoglycan-binding domain-containing protein [Carboxylicivirga sp. M1479]
MPRLVMCIILLMMFKFVDAINYEYPHYPQWMYENRLSELDKETVVKLDYNSKVQAYIDVYTIKRREHLSNIIGQSEFYFPLFEEYLAKYDLPMELKYLAIVESALDPKAKSTSGAMGLWQFLYHASRMFDLKVDNYVDERCDPVKSTEAACRYLKYLHRNLNDWQLALAAYNGGIGVVQKAIERSGGKTNFWELQPYLPKAVQSYVPAFIAVNYVMNNYEKHDVEKKPAILNFNEVDTVFIHKSLSFDQIAKASKTPIEVVEWLNPSYTKSFIPVNDQAVCVFLPKKGMLHFVRAVNDLSEAQKPTSKIVPVGDVTGKESTVHIVQKGEFFHKIAIDNNCRISDIMHWNNLKSRRLLIDQKLIVWRPKKAPKVFFVTEVIESDKPVIQINQLYSYQQITINHH